MSLAAALFLQILGQGCGSSDRTDCTLLPFADLRQVAPPLAGTLHATLADLTGDGAPEAILSSSGAYPSFPNAVLYNDGEGGLGPRECSLCNGTPTFGETGYAPSDRSAAGDLDGDGDLDVLVGSIPYRNDGRGRLRRQPSPLPPLSDVTAIALLDLEGDGDLDAVLGRRTQSYVLRNEGAGVFVDASTLLPAGPALELVGLDAERDGDTDLVRAGVLLRNDGSGAFAPDPLAIQLASIDPSNAFQAGDADGDGFPELFVAHYPVPGAVTLLANAAGVRFEEQGTLPAPRAIDAFSLADFDRDGDLDLLSVEATLLLGNDGHGTFQEASTALPAPLASPVASQVVADLDRDGDLDVLTLPLTVSPFLGSVSKGRLWLGDGAGAFLEAQRHVPPEPFRPLELADVDGDGDSDVVGTAVRAPARAIARLNDGHGSLRQAPELFESAPLPASPTDAVAGDVDGDGDADLVWAQPLQDVLHVNRGAQGFADETVARLPLESRPTRALALADLDADGDLDLLLANGTASVTSTLWLNDGGGVFADASGLLPPRYEITNAYAVGDVDGDGRLDVFAANAVQNALLLGDEELVLRDATERLPIASAGIWSLDVALADLDGDGDLDAYTANAMVTSGQPPHGGSTLPAAGQVLLNEGDRFVHDPARQPNLDLGQDLALGDYDEDGDVDVLVGTRIYLAGTQLRGGETFYYQNVGDGFLSQRYVQRDDHVLEQEMELLVGDLDGDLDLDVVAPERVLTNTTRGLAWRTLPRPGRRLSFDVFGPQNEPFLLLAASARASLATDEGLFGLDPSALLLARAGRLDALAHARVDFLAPSGLAGETLYWQALVGGSPRLTNLEPTTFTEF